MEKIISIKEGSFEKNKYSSYAGYIIETNKQVIKFGISDHQSCCESWGYFSSEDDFDEFVGDLTGYYNLQYITLIMVIMVMM